MSLHPQIYTEYGVQKWRPLPYPIGRDREDRKVFIGSVGQIPVPWRGLTDFGNASDKL